jgi:hypothetical protein
MQQRFVVMQQHLPVMQRDLQLGVLSSCSSIVDSNLTNLCAAQTAASITSPVTTAVTATPDCCCLLLLLHHCCHPLLLLLLLSVCQARRLRT